ncbi:hypothetical protein DFH29DRAFT_872973 [Suillus ampliporus]|nr:hypothetical protein DFH29DRAFT_872973 [Suillus ampliporus]
MAFIYEIIGVFIGYVVVPSVGYLLSLTLHVIDCCIGTYTLPLFLSCMNSSAKPPPPVTQPNVELPPPLTQPNVKLLPPLMQPNVELPSPLTQPNVKLPPTLTQPEVNPHQLLMQPNIKPPPQPTIKLLPPLMQPNVEPPPLMQADTPPVEPSVAPPAEPTHSKAVVSLVPGRSKQEYKESTCNEVVNSISSGNIGRENSTLKMWPKLTHGGPAKNVFDFSLLLSKPVL